MSLQPLSAKRTRALAATLGERTITRAYASDIAHSVVLFVTWDHCHGWYDRHTGEWDWSDPDDPHLPDCLDDAGELLVEVDPLNDDGHWPTLNY